MNNKQILSSYAKVRFQDCDPFNHLNNSKYIDYFINAREDQILENYDLDMQDFIKKNRTAWVVSTSQIAYIKPAHTMEEVLIESQLIQHSEKHLLVELRMYDQMKTHLKSFLWITFVHISLREQKAAAHSSELMELFKNVELPIEDRFFESRKTTLIKKSKY
ncbi:hypothetical protein UJ101_00509 [Flavobacteriaceae bacterium UJ101]|nr:hypothetical protein UJ101_00509 [Flavobacteriaceae bacterium UJ101]